MKKLILTLIIFTFAINCFCWTTRSNRDLITGKRDYAIISNDGHFVSDENNFIKTNEYYPDFDPEVVIYIDINHYKRICIAWGDNVYTDEEEKNGKDIKICVYDAEDNLVSGTPYIVKGNIDYSSPNWYCNTFIDDPKEVRTLINHFIRFNTVVFWTSQTQNDVVYRRNLKFSLKGFTKAYKEYRHLNNKTLIKIKVSELKKQFEYVANTSVEIDDDGEVKITYMCLKRLENLEMRELLDIFMSSLGYDRTWSTHKSGSLELENTYILTYSRRKE